MATEEPRPGRPGESLSNVVPSLQISVLPVLGSRDGQAPGVGAGVTSNVVGPKGWQA